MYNLVGFVLFGYEAVDVFCAGWSRDGCVAEGGGEDGVV